MDLKNPILKYALQNAVRYEGRANPGAIIGKIIAEKPDLKNKIGEIKKEIIDTVNHVNSLSIDEQKKLLTDLAPELLEEKKHEERHLPELPNAEKGKVVMRIAPYPSGPLHIGNARTAVLNDEYVKLYDGKLLFVMDDTIGSEEKTIAKEAYKLIPEGLKWIKCDFKTPIIYKSKRLKIYYKYAIDIIKKDKAYVCFCNSEELRKNRAKGTECGCRNRTIKENLKEWKNLLKGKYKEGEATLRIKTSMQHENPAFRDRVIFRISEREHPKTKNKFKVWPLLDFSWAIDDYLLGMTHIIRGKELMMESEMEKYIWDIFGWKHCELLHNGLFQLEGVKISKSKSKKEVESGVYTGWDDPRTWSLQALKRRGFNPDAIRIFLISFGMNQTEIIVPLSALYSENRKFIEKDANRYFFIGEPVEIKIENAPKVESKLKLHPDFKERGFRALKSKGIFYVAKKDFTALRRENCTG